MRLRAALPSTHRIPRTPATTLLLLLLLLPACTDEGSDPMQADDTGSITGHVRLVGTLFTLSGDSTGTRIVDDATGVPVTLLNGATMRSTTTTVDGAYSFPGLPAGDYEVGVSVVPEHVLATSVTVASDAVAADMLVVEPWGEMNTSPNPAAADGTGLEFTMQAPGPFTTTIRSLGGEVLWSVAMDAAAGFNHIHWDGGDDTHHVAEDGEYWAVVEKENTLAYNLVFWASEEVETNPGNCGHVEGSGYLLTSPDSVVVSAWEGMQFGEIRVPVGATADSLHWTFLTDDSTEYAVADSCSINRMTWTVADSTVASVSRDPGAEWTFHVAGLQAGSTTLVLDAWHEAHIHLSSEPIPIEVTTP